MRVAIFAGSFNPFTIGHYDIAIRGLEIFDKVVIAVGRNAAKADSTADVDEIRSYFEGNERIEVCAYSGLTAELAKQYGAQYLLRGVRSVKDFEYERDMAAANTDLGGLETVLLYTRPEYAHISSSLVRELKSYGRDVTNYLPKR